MTAKEYLSQYHLLNLRINSLIEERQRTRELAGAVSSPMSGGGGHSSDDRIGKIIAKLVDLENEINSDIDRLISLRKDIETVIDSVPDETQRQLLIARYINGRTFEQIAVEMHYSWRHTIRIHGDALSAVQNVIECHIGKVV